MTLFERSQSFGKGTERVEIKGSEKRDKHLDLSRVTVIPVVCGTLRMIPKVLERGLKESKSKEESRSSKL